MSFAPSDTTRGHFRTAKELIASAKAKGINCEPPINLGPLADFLGIRVRNDVTLDAENVIGKISFEDGAPVISVNPYQNRYVPRRRFTIAHEIGHFCLHASHSGEEFVDSRRSMSRSATMWDTHEREANQFAAELLMPEDEIYRVGAQILDENDRLGRQPMSAHEFVTRMADRFLVSNEAMTYRLEGLDIL